MTEEQELLAEALEVAGRLARGLALGLDEVRALGTLDADRLGRLTRPEEKDVLAFLKTFEQMQDLVARIRAAMKASQTLLEEFGTLAAFARNEIGGPS